MAKFILGPEFLSAIDEIDQQIDGLITQKIELLLKELLLNEAHFIENARNHYPMVFSIPDRGMVMQLNGICNEKSRLLFVIDKKSGMLQYRQATDYSALDRYRDRQSRIDKRHEVIKDN